MADIGDVLGHFYPRPPRGGRPGGMPNPRAVKEISIHALREEGDHRSLFRSAQKIDFYPRPPRGGRPYRSWYFKRRIQISIHALREEGDRSR